MSKTAKVKRLLQEIADQSNMPHESPRLTRAQRAQSPVKDDLVSLEPTRRSPNRGSPGPTASPGRAPVTPAPKLIDPDPVADHLPIPQKQNFRPSPPGRLPAPSPLFQARDSLFARPPPPKSAMGQVQPAPAYTDKPYAYREAPPAVYDSSHEDLYSTNTHGYVPPKQYNNSYFQAQPSSSDPINCVSTSRYDPSSAPAAPMPGRFPDAPIRPPHAPTPRRFPDVSDVINHSEPSVDQPSFGSEPPERFQQTLPIAGAAAPSQVLSNLSITAAPYMPTVPRNNGLVKGIQEDAQQRIKETKAHLAAERSKFDAVTGNKATSLYLYDSLDILHNRQDVDLTKLSKAVASNHRDLATLNESAAEQKNYFASAWTTLQAKTQLFNQQSQQAAQTNHEMLLNFDQDIAAMKQRRDREDARYTQLETSTDERFCVLEAAQTRLEHSVRSLAQYQAPEHPPRTAVAEPQSTTPQDPLPAGLSHAAIPPAHAPAAAAPAANAAYVHSPLNPAQVHNTPSSAPPPLSRHPNGDGRSSDVRFAAATAPEPAPKLKRDEVGIFQPDHADDVDGQGMICKGKTLIFVDAHAFENRIKYLISDPVFGKQYEVQLTSMLPNLLAGGAAIWWNNEIGIPQQHLLRHQGTEALMTALVERFRPNRAIANHRFVSGTLKLSDLTENPHAIELFIARKLNLARTIGMYNPDEETSWMGTMFSIWGQMDLEIKKYLPPPQTDDTYVKYMRRVADAKSSLLLIVPPTSAVADSDRPKRFDRARFDRTKSPTSYDKRPAGDNRKPYRDNKPGGYDNKPGGYDRRSGNPRPRDNDRKDYRRSDDQKPQNRVHFAGSAANADAREPSTPALVNADSSPDESDDESCYSDSDDGRGNYFVIDRALICPNCQVQFTDPALKLEHDKVCKSELDFNPPKTDVRNFEEQTVERRTCTFCYTVFASRSHLFTHLSQCSWKSRNEHKPKQDVPPPKPHLLLPTGTGVVVKNSPAILPADVDKAEYTHARITIRSKENGGTVQKVCPDTGAAESMITLSFLEGLTHTVYEADRRIHGVGGSKQMRQRAVFEFFVDGTEHGKPVTRKFTHTSWVYPAHLAPQILLGSDFLKPHGGTMDYNTDLLTCAALNDFTVPFECQLRGKAVIRKVTSRDKISLPSGQSCYAAVDFSAIPKNRSFAFYSTHDNAAHGIINAQTPRVVALVNTSPDLVTIPKRSRLGYIGEHVDSGSLKSSWKAALAAVTVASALLWGASGAHHGTGPHDPVSAPVAVNTEFPMTPITTAVAADIESAAPIGTDSYVSSTQDLTPATVADNGTPSYTAMVSDILDGNLAKADATYSHLLQSEDPPILPVASPATEVLLEATPDETPDAEPKYNQLTMGIRRPDDLTERVVDDIHIFADNAVHAQGFEDVIHEFPDLWKDIGLIDVPLEEQMKVPLVDGWQRHKLASRPYPLSIKDKAVVDKIYDTLHDQGRMRWAHEPGPFAQAVFVVYRSTAPDAKGRAVVDLRPLNRVAVPDNYPLPLQSEVINSLRGKSFISVVDATSFFHQFPVHPDYRDRFTVVTHRGIEQSIVAMMGFKNSPAYVQRFMDKLLRPHQMFARAFIDDIVIFSESFEEHQRHLREIFGLFVSKNIAISPTKSFIGYPSVDLLGFRVNGFGYSTTAQKVHAFQALAFPDRLKALESYIGATGFLRHLIPYYAKLIEPLQQRKTALLAAGRDEGKVVDNNKSKRTAYCRSTTYTPSECEKRSFEAIQAAICSESAVHHFSPHQRLFLKIDGCTERGFGAVAFHLRPGYTWTPGTKVPSNQVLPICYLSRCLSPAETRYGPSEQEVGCLYWTVRKLRTMIQSSELPVTVLTDHSATKGIVERTTIDTSSADRANRRLVNCSIYLSQYQLEVHHLPGAENFVPDALSRLAAIQDAAGRPPGPPILDEIFLAERETLANVFFTSAEAKMDDSLKAEYIQGYAKDSRWRNTIEQLKEVPADDEGTFRRPGIQFELRDDGLLYHVATYKNHRSLCVPRSMVDNLMHAVHDERNHAGEKRMLHALEDYVFTSKAKLARQYIQHCPACALNRTDRQKKIGSYKPIVPAERLPMRTIAIDFIDALPEVSSAGSRWALDGSQTYHKNFNMIMTVSCPVSKRCILVPGHKRYKAIEWGQVLVRRLLDSDWGLPRGIISDRDPKFVSDIWTGLWKAFGTRLIMTTAYHPQGDGLSERRNQSIEIALRYHYFEHPDVPWIDILPLLQWNQNSGYSETVNASPHEMIYGMKLLGPSDVMAPTDEHRLKDLPDLRQQTRREAEFAMDYANAYAKRIYDSKHRPIEFEVGQEVYLRLHQGYTLPHKPHRKFSQQRSGPWKITKRIGNYAYELNFPDTFRIHKVVSVAHLTPKPAAPDPFNRAIDPPGPVEMEGDQYDLWETERVLKHRPNRSRTRWSYCVKFKGWGDQFAEWIDEKDLADSQEIVEDYWQAQGGRQEVPPREKGRGPGRPRKDATMTEPQGNRGRGRPRKET